VLAMAYWQKEDREEARRWYDTGVRWIEENQTNLKQHPEAVKFMARIRAEAEELVGIEKKEP
jgi:hypothetical protein